jgi:branched-chain amino acid transport system permease protein
MQFLIDTLLNAAMASAATALVSIGLALIFGVMRVENFAHGELYMVGAYVTWYVTVKIGLGYFAGFAGAVAVTAAIGAVMEVALFRRLRSNPVGALIVTVGVLLILQTSMVWLAGINSTLLVDSPFPGALRLGPINLPWHRLFVIVSAIVLLACLAWLLRGTRFGWAIRAAAQDREAASLQGISIGRVAVYALMLSAGLAGAAGSLMAPLVRISPFMGQPIIITAFIVVIMGGIGSIEGAIIASVLYSTFYTFISAYIDGTIATIAGLCIMLAVLIFMPSGLLGKAEKV